MNGGEVPLPEHPAAIAKLSEQFPHSIQHVKDEAKRAYNCFTAALGLADNNRVYEILEKDKDWYGWAGVKVGPEFVSRLIQQGALVKDDVGRVIIYFRDAKPLHAGIVVGDRVRSKWGVGHLWEHGPWEVPRSYGPSLDRFTIVRADLVEPEFEAYAAELFASRGGYPD